MAAVCALYGPRASWQRTFALACVLLNPAAVIIDHGHFQYNCISLGLAAGAAAAIVWGAHIMGSVLFCLALSHKQMALYYAPAFFAHLLGCCLQRRSALEKVIPYFYRKCGCTKLSALLTSWAACEGIPLQMWASP
jgi:alpha-1,3-glucosyltransferase